MVLPFIFYLYEQDYQIFYDRHRVFGGNKAHLIFLQNVDVTWPWGGNRWAISNRSKHNTPSLLIDRRSTYGAVKEGGRG